jgi:hypothetical protein
MPPNVTLKTWLKDTKKTWGLVTQFAVFIFGVVGSFLLPPPGWASSGGNKTVVRLAQFIVAVLVGLIFLLVQRWNKRKHVSRWAIFAILFLALSVSAFFVYQHLLDTRTCQYVNDAVVIGTRYTEHAQSYLRENPNSTCSSLLDDFAGKAEDIWTKDSINQSRYILASTYILNLPLFTICIIAVVQALYCSQAKASR